jgi:hypothetical protein
MTLFMDQNPMKNQAPPAPKVAGNVLFIILLGIALFAALSYVGTKGFRTGGGQLTEEKSRLVATEIINYANAMRNTIQTLHLNGCNISQAGISFYSPLFSNPAFYQMSGVPERCQVFHPKGGNITWAAPPKDISSVGAVEFSYLGSMSIFGAGKNNADYTTRRDRAKELIMLTHVTPQVCKHINATLGVLPPDTAPPTFALGHAIPPTNIAVYGPSNQTTGGFINTVELGADGHALAGKYTGCYYSSTLTKYQYYQVLYAQ